MQLAEVRSVLEVSGPAEADRTAASHPGLTDDPSAAPLLARIDGELGRKKQALERLRVAHERSPQDANIQYDYVATAIELGDDEVARKTSEEFLKAFPNSVAAQLRFLEAHSNRQGRDEAAWTGITLRFLVEHRHEPEAMSQLGSLAASKGWSDVAFLLYVNSLEENLTGFPFAIYYVASLVKTGDFQAADAALRELSIRNSSQVQQSAYLAAMIDWGTGRESEAMQIVQQLRRETADDPRRRHTIESVFRSYGFLKVADQLVAAGS
jgi:tetratricopeptide (TPR) repeat protein